MQLIHRLYIAAIKSKKTEDVEEGIKRLIRFYGDEEKGKAVAELLNITVEHDKYLADDADISEDFIASLWEANDRVKEAFMKDIKIEGGSPASALEAIRSLPFDSWARNELIGELNKLRAGRLL